MGCSVALKTKSEKQANDILSFIENNIPALRPKTHVPISWCIGKDLAYIKDTKSIGSNDTPSDLIERIYFYTIFYQIGVKFKLSQTINGIECVIVNYDDMEEICLSKENPYPEGHEKYYTYSKIREDGISNWETKGFMSKLFGQEPNKNEFQFLQNLVTLIQEHN